MSVNLEKEVARSAVGHPRDSRASRGVAEPYKLGAPEELHQIFHPAHAGALGSQVADESAEYESRVLVGEAAHRAARVVTAVSRAQERVIGVVDE